MAETITITIPETPEERREVLRFLEDKGLVTVETSRKRGRYAELARQYSQENLLTGFVTEVSELRKAFRDDFSL